MTPKQRIRRIRRWIEFASENPTQDCYVSAGRVIQCQGYDHRPRNWQLRARRIRRADLLFAAELAWLTEYATELREFLDCAYSEANNRQIEIESFLYAHGDKP